MSSIKKNSREFFLKSWFQFANRSLNFKISSIKKNSQEFFLTIVILIGLNHHIQITVVSISWSYIFSAIFVIGRYANKLFSKKSWGHFKFQSINSGSISIQYIFVKNSFRNRKMIMIYVTIKRLEFTNKQLELSLIRNHPFIIT